MLDLTMWSVWTLLCPLYSALCTIKYYMFTRVHQEHVDIDRAINLLYLDIIRGVSMPYQMTIIKMLMRS